MTSKYLLFFSLIIFFFSCTVKNRDIEFIKDDEKPVYSKELEPKIVEKSTITTKTVTTKVENTEKKLSVEKPKKQQVVVIDAGHGGKDQGAEGIDGRLEKHYVLNVALKLKEDLENKGFKVILTRNDDTFIPLKDRTKIANENKADLFISLHGNSSPFKETKNTKNSKNKEKLTISKKSEPNGFQVFYLDNTDDVASIKLSERENFSFEDEDKDKDEISFLISDLIQNSKVKESIEFAEKINKSVKEEFKDKYPKANFHEVEKAPFYVLTGTIMPSVLIEMFFIDSKNDIKIIEDNEFLETFTNGLIAGIQNFLK